MAQISRVRRVRAGAHCVKWNTVFLELTWIRLLPQSATMILPLVSTATPVGALNWPLPSPWEPNLYRNSPSALYTCRKNNWPVTCLSHRNCFCVTGKMTILKQQQETCVLACLINQKQCSFAILNVCKIVSSSHTLTEWLWKSVTTISFLLFTATKWGPGISRGNKKGKKERKDESPRIFQCVAGSSTLFLDWTENVQHGGDKDTRWCERVCETRQKLSSSVEKKKKRTRICHTHGGNIYLLKAGPDLLSFCSSAMFAPLFSTRKEKVQVRDETERKDDFQSWVCATKDAYGSIPGEQKCSTFCCQTLKGGKKIKASLCISQQTGGF